MGNTRLEIQMKVFVVLALLAAVAAAQDPAGSWLSYTEYDAPGTITFMSANWTVPSNPKDPFGGNAPGFWPGVTVFLGGRSSTVCFLGAVRSRVGTSRARSRSIPVTKFRPTSGTTRRRKTTS